MPNLCVSNSPPKTELQSSEIYRSILIYILLFYILKGCWTTHTCRVDSKRHFPHQKDFVTVNFVFLLFVWKICFRRIEIIKSCRRQLDHLFIRCVPRASPWGYMQQVKIEWRACLFICQRHGFTFGLVFSYFFLFIIMVFFAALMTEISLKIINARHWPVTSPLKWVEGFWILGGAENIGNELQIWG